MTNIDWNGWNKFKEGLQENFARSELPVSQFLMCEAKKSRDFTDILCIK